MANDISTTFNDKEMLLIEPDWIEEVESRFDVKRRIVGNELSSINTDAPINLELNYPIQSSKNKYDLIDFFNSRKSNIESFWYCHPADFFTLKDNYTAGGSYILCERNYSHLWTQSLPSQYDWGIYIKMRNGDLIARKITGIVDQSSPNASVVYLDETIPVNITADNYYLIGRMLVGRFDEDILTLQMESNSQGLANIKLKENYRVYDSWTPIEGISLWDVAMPNYGDRAGTAAALSLVAPFSGDITNSLGSYSMGGSYDTIYYYNIYIRFDNVEIPQGVTVKSARVQLVCYGENGSRGFNFNWSCADYDDQPSFGTVAAWKALNRTTTVQWYLANGNVWVPGERYSTPDLAVAFQDIVDRPGWVSGNGILVCGDQISDVGYPTKSWTRPGPNETNPYHPRLILEWV